MNKRSLLFILMHGLAKDGLFLCAGIVEHNTHTKDIRQNEFIQLILQQIAGRLG
jgi:NADH:ubiquinone oxidoreductase subunit 5 (subunit L)/multisubunit Na+/H+ antiporter MnhA subunit